MKTSRIVLTLALSTVIFVGASGCDTFILPGALAKLANNQLGALTGDEIRALSQVAADFINAQVPGAGATAFTPEQAQAIANFMMANGVTTAEDLDALLMMAANDPGSVQGLAELAEAFQGTGQEFDPDAPTEEELSQLFDFTQQ